ncbi:MAG: alpha/beta hydrolase-fold protein [Pyrinomonadaceae bacterium]
MPHYALVPSLGNHNEATSPCPKNRYILQVMSLLSGFLFLLLISAPVSAQVQAVPPPTIPGVTTLRLKSDVLGEERVILVRTPQGYEAGTQRYPVIYLTDGAAHIAHTSSTVEFLSRNGRMSELIVVGIPNTDRMRDLSPTHVSTAGATGGPQFPTSGGGDKFLKFIETELIPDIEKRYRTHPYRVLAGHSLGGLFVINAMVTRPEVFNAYVAVSPALQWDNQVVVKRAEDFFRTRKDTKERTLYFSLGNEPGPIEDAFHQFKQVLAKQQGKGFEWEAQEMADEDHGSVVLRSHYSALRKIYSDWRIPQDPNTGQIAGDLKGAEDHYRKLSEKFGFNLPVPENLINQIGYQLLFADKPDEAITAFKLNVERYPESANPYDSLAEAYERGGKFDLAAPLYEKAWIVGQRNKDPNVALYKTNFDRVSGKLKQAESAPKP